MKQEQQEGMSMEDKEKGKKRMKEIMQHFHTLQTRRQPFDRLLQDVADYVQPDRGGFSSSLVVGDDRRQRLFDSTAIQANELFAAFLHGMLTNPASRWFELKVADKRLQQDAVVNEWLEMLTEQAYAVLQGGRAGFATALHETYLDLGIFGTACLFVGDQPGRGVSFKAIPLSQIYVSENMDGQVDTVFRRFRLTARQMAERWGADKLSDRVQKMLQRDEQEEVELLHMVAPRQTYDARKIGGQHRPFASCYMELSPEHLIQESGYEELPYMAPRLSKVSGEIYGRSPAMTALADIKMINAMAKANIRGAQKLIDPPILVPNDGFISRGGLGPGDIAYYDSTVDGPDKVRPLASTARPDIGLNIMEDVRQRIRGAFYVDQLLLGGSANMSATEVLARQEEKLRLMGPMLGRLQAELLDPMLRRVLRLMEQAGQFPALPREYGKVAVRAMYVSPIARAQRLGDTEALGMTLQKTASLLAADPAVAINLNADKAFRGIAERHGVPGSWLRDEAEIALMREQEAAAATPLAGVQAALQQAIGGAANEIPQDAVEGEQA